MIVNSVNNRRRGLTLLAAVALVLGLVASGPAPRALAAGNPNPGVIPPDARPYGHTYGEWSNMWWQWAFSLPVPPDNPQAHPLWDETGINCGAGQSGPVWFLGGVVNVSGTAVRTQCVVPAGKAIFFPILNTECSNVEGNGMTEPELRACANGIGIPPNMEADVDGVLIQNIESYRAGFSVPPPYNFTLPDNNFLQFFGLDAPAGNCYVPQGGTQCVPYLSVSDGYYLMLTPLTAGTHTIHFFGGDPNAFHLDITYGPLTVR